MQLNIALMRKSMLLIQIRKGLYRVRAATARFRTANKASQFAGFFAAFQLRTVGAVVAFRRHSRSIPHRIKEVHLITILFTH